MWDFVKNIGSWVGDFAGLDGSFGADKAFGAATGAFSLGNVSNAFGGLFSSGSGTTNTTSSVKLPKGNGLFAGIGKFASSDAGKAIIPAAVKGGLSLYGTSLAVGAQKEANQNNLDMQNKYYDYGKKKDEYAAQKYARAGLAFNA